jgi:hypothetical protein
MLWAIVVAGFAAPPLPAQSAVIRTVAIGVYTKKPEPVADLTPEEVDVSERGQRAKVLSVEPDRRPLEAAIVVDSSAVVASSYRSDLVAAVVALWKGLPAGSSVGVWTSGPPSRVVEFGSDLAAAEPRLQSVAPAGKNYAFDAMLDASRELERRAAPRRALVFVGGLDIELSRSRTAELQRSIGQAAATPMLVLVGSSGATAPLGGPTQGAANAWDVQGYLEQLASAYGGSCAVVLTTQAAQKRLLEAAVDLSSQYIVRYESTAGFQGAPKLEVRRKGVKLRIGFAGIQVARPGGGR